MTNNLGTAAYVTKMAGEDTKGRTSFTTVPSEWSWPETVSLDKDHYLTVNQVYAQLPGHFIAKVTCRQATQVLMLLHYD